MLRAQVQPILPHQRVSATARLTRGTCLGSESATMRYGSSRGTAKMEAVVVAAKKGGEVAQRFPSRSSVTHEIRGAAVRAVHAVFCARHMKRAIRAVYQSGLSRSYVMHGANRHHRRRHVRHSPDLRRLGGVCTVARHGHRVAKRALTQTHSRTKA